ncbi:MAG: radical SAM protein [Desulfobacula sp.]|nr:radical SAM protein [Desulfobacula sp.]
MSYHHIFGPVLSRRLGVSLGVDLVTHKICSMDCIYCECGKTTQKTCERKEYVPFDSVIKELDHYFENHPDPDYITFSGSGEPTLNSCLGRVIDHIKDKRPEVNVAVLTNASLFSDQKVTKQLFKANLVVPSLDAVTKKAFLKINRPCATIDVAQIVSGMVDFAAVYKGKIRLEVFILPGINDERADLEMLKGVIRQINPDRVQLNTLDRPGTLSNIRPATGQELSRVIKILDYQPIEIIAKVQKTVRTIIKRNDIPKAILETIHRRPCTKTDLQTILGVEQARIEDCILLLEKEKKIEGSQQERGMFYQTIKEAGK